MSTTDHTTTDDTTTDYMERTQDVIAPVAVAVVAAEPLRVQRYPSREFTTGSVAVAPGATPIQVIGANPFRETLFLTNMADYPVYIGPARDTLTPSGGYPLAPGQDIALSTRHAIYAMAADDDNPPPAAPLHFLAEHVDG
jgi:hypothetical protein